MQNLPPEVAARQAGRVVAAPPSPNTWLVAASLGAPDSGEPLSDEVFLDVTQKGALLDGAAARSRFPNLDFAVSSSLDSRRARSASGGGGASIVGVWSEMARTMVTAHQRRGESDLVAHWLYQAMALDTRAPEWPHSMSARQ